MNTCRFFLFVIICCIQASLLGASDQVMRKQVNPITDLLKPAWSKVTPDKRGAPFPTWSYRVTFPMPVSWPPKEVGAVYYYAYAYLFSPAIVDGERQSYPWARVLVSADKSQQASVELLRKDVKELGIAGVRPLSKTEAQIYATGVGIEKQLIKLDAKNFASADTDDLKKFYCTWIKNNALISSELKKNHSTFFAWLNCNK